MRVETIVLDPPWPMAKIERDVRPNQVAFDYPTMSEDELRKFGEAVNRMAAGDRRRALNSSSTARASAADRKARSSLAVTMPRCQRRSQRRL